MDDAQASGTPSRTLQTLPDPDRGQAATAEPLPPTVSSLLRTAAVLDGLAMAYLLLLPGHFWLQVNHPSDVTISLWQWVGLLVGVMGLGCWLGAADPVRHRLVIRMVGLARLLALPLVAWQVWGLGHLPGAVVWLVLAWGGVWVLPFHWCLKEIRRVEGDRFEPPPLSEAEATRPGRVNEADHPRTLEAWLAATHTSLGPSLAELSHRQKVLVVFLRHLGCTFCREAVADLVAERASIEAQGAVIVLVHMGRPEQIERLLARYGAGRMHHVADPKQHLYEAFRLRRGRLSQLFGPAVWWRGLVAGLLRGHGVGLLAGDGFQMPGVFLLYQERVIVAFRHAHVAERPDYAGFCRLPHDPAPDPESA